MTAPAGLLEDRVPARYATVAADGPDHCIVTTVGQSSRWFLMHMAMLDVEMTVLGPPELVAEAATIGRRLTAA